MLEFAGIDVSKVMEIPKPHQFEAFQVRFYEEG